MTIKGPFAITLLVLLFLSLSANLVIAGFTLARISGPRQGGEIERIVALGVRAFPEQIREVIALRAREQREVLQGKLAVVEDARQQMFAAMRAEPFDQGALDQAYDALREATVELQRAGQDIVTQALAGAPPDVRRRIRQRHRRPPR